MDITCLELTQSYDLQEGAYIKEETNYEIIEIEDCENKWFAISITFSNNVL